MGRREKGNTVQKQERMGYETANLRLTIPKSGAQVSEGDEVAVTIVWANSDPAQTCIALIADTPANKGVPIHLGAHAALLFTSQACRKFRFPVPRNWYVLTARAHFGIYDRNQECIKPISVAGWDPGTMESFIRHTPLVQALWLEHVLMVEQHFAAELPRLADCPSALFRQSTSGLMVGQGATIVDAGNLAAATITYVSHDKLVVGVKRDQVPMVRRTSWCYRLAVYTPSPFGQPEFFTFEEDGRWTCSTGKSGCQLLIGVRLFGAPPTLPAAPSAPDSGAKGQNILK